jgi:hypothetical protein
VEGPSDDELVDDDELAALALSGDLDQPLDPDAVPLELAAGTSAGLLPDWYMPAPRASVRGRARRFLIGGLVIAFMVINGAGLCVTYGVPEIAW